MEDSNRKPQHNLHMWPKSATLSGVSRSRVLCVPSFPLRLRLLPRRPRWSCLRLAQGLAWGRITGCFPPRWHMLGRAERCSAILSSMYRTPPVAMPFLWRELSAALLYYPCRLTLQYCYSRDPTYPIDYNLPVSVPICWFSTRRPIFRVWQKKSLSFVPPLFRPLPTWCKRGKESKNARFSALQHPLRHLLGLPVTHPLAGADAAGTCQGTCRYPLRHRCCRA